MSGALQDARAKIGDGDLLMAAVLLSEQAKATPSSAEVLAELSRLALVSARIDRALVLSDKALGLKADEPVALAVRAILARGMGDETRAKTLLAAAIKADPNSLGARFELARFAMQDQAWAIAEEHLQAILQSRPEHAGALHWLGLVYIESGREAEAYAIWEKATTLAPSHMGAYRELAHRHVAKGDVDGGLRWLQKALSVVPDYVAFRRDVMALYVRQGKLQEACAEQEKIAEVDPTLGNIIDAAQYAASLGRMPRAFQHARRAAERYPLSPLPHVAMAELHRASHAPDQAEAAYRRALEIMPGGWNTRQLLGELLMQQKRPAEARVQFELSVRQEQLEWQAYYNCALFYAEMGEVSGALAEVEKALLRMPTLLPKRREVEALRERLTLAQKTTARDKRVS